MMQIKIIGPTSRWFGVGFGSDSMSNTYSIIAHGDDFNVTERTLSSSSGGTELSVSGNVSVSESGDSRTLVLEREYNVDGTFDFTDFMECTDMSIDIISAKGSDTSFAYHGGG